MNAPKKQSVKASSKNAARPAGEAGEAIRVVPKRAGFRRAGYEFPEDGLLIPLSELTAEQLEQLESEPMLVTNRTDAPEVEETGPATDGTPAE